MTEQSDPDLTTVRLRASAMARLQLAFADIAKGKAADALVILRELLADVELLAEVD